MQECSLEPLQFKWFRAAMRFNNSSSCCNSTTNNNILQADMQLSTRSDTGWFSLVPSAMEVLAHSHNFKQNLLNCEPVELVVFSGSCQASMLLRAFLKHAPKTVIANNWPTTKERSIYKQGLCYVIS